MKLNFRCVRLGFVFLLLLGGLLVFLPYSPVAAKLQPSNSSVFAIAASAPATPTKPAGPPNGIIVGHSVKNDRSPNLRDIPPVPVRQPQSKVTRPLLKIPGKRVNAPDAVVQRNLFPLSMPATILNFDGIAFPGANCNCAPPDPNGAIGATQYVQIVNTGLQVFDKATGTLLLGPITIESVWSGFGGVCEINGGGDPIVLYDQIANRWVIGQMAGTSAMTDECVAVSTTNDATWTWNRYDFNLGSNFFDYPKLAVWTDAYYLADNVFDSAGVTYFGPQPFALDRNAMLNGQAATFVSPGIQSSSLGFLLPANLDGSILPPTGAPNPWMGAFGSSWPLYRFHVDFVTPANSTFTLATSLSPASYSDLCPSTSSCVPQLGISDGLDGIGDRPMFRLAYRRFSDGHEALVGNRSVTSNGVAGIRWWEVNNATSGTPTFVQQSTYQPDSTWRWLGSLAMDSQGNMALGFSASSGSIYPQIRYAGRLATDTPNTMAQGEALLYAGTGSQIGTSNRWGDYSGLTVDPTDDCTFWYTNEYLPSTGSYNWRTRIGNFRFPSCTPPADFTIFATPSPQSICAPSDAAYLVTLGSLNSFSNQVTLSTSNRPAGTSAGFSVNPVVPSGTSSLTIGNTGAASAGSYKINVIGTYNSLVHTSTVGLNLYTATPSVTTLTSPTNGNNTVGTQPTFTWAASSQAVSYTLDIALDANFNNLAYSISGLTGTSYNGVTLNYNTTYYWRVRAGNTCGTSNNSTPFNFTTVEPLGACSIGTTPNMLYYNDFETSATGWTHNSAVGADTWVITTTNPHSGTHAWHVDDSNTLSDQRLVSPAITLPLGQNPVTLKYWNYQSIENYSTGCYDGAILEASTNGGASWTQMVAPTLLTNPYNGPVSSSYGNPLAGLNAWCGNPQPYLNSIVDISAYAGQSVQFRFRLGSDGSVGEPGWNIDDVVVQSCAKGFSYLPLLNK